MAREKTRKTKPRIAKQRPHRVAVAKIPEQMISGRIDRLGGQGEGVLDTAAGPVFAPYTAPGDEGVFVVADARARLVELNKASPDRQDPSCPHFGDCGGCATQHLRPAFTDAWKLDRLRHALARADLPTDVIQPMVKLPLAARRRARFVVRKSADGAMAFGFHRRASGSVCTLTQCDILDPALAASLPLLRRVAMAAAWPKFDLGVTLCDNGLDIDLYPARIDDERPRSRTGAQTDTGVDLAEIGPLLSEAPRDDRPGKTPALIRVSIDSAPVITAVAPIVSFDGVPAMPPPGTFLQASRQGQAALIALVRDGVGDARIVADLFSGMGAFALPLAQSTAITAVDNDRPAIAALGRAVGDAQRAGRAITPVVTHVRNLFQRPMTAEELASFDAVVFDPPRAGAVAQAKMLAAAQPGKGPRRLVAVSCNPGTFVRDAAILSQGSFVLKSVTPVDQFAYSSHIELVAVLERK